MLVANTTATGRTRIIGTHLACTGSGGACLEIQTSAALLARDLKIERIGTGIVGIFTAKDGQLFYNTDFISFPTVNQSRWNSTRGKFWSIMEMADGLIEYGGWKNSQNYTDDSAKNITPPKRQGRARLFLEGSSLTAYSIEFTYDLQSNSITSVTEGASASVVATTALTGTSGVDGEVSVSGSGGAIYIENRSGATRDITVVFD